MNWDRIEGNWKQVTAWEGRPTNPGSARRLTGLIRV
jgi:hypothetical protein